MSSRPYKIALICSTFNQLGGPAAHMRNLYTHLNGGKFQVTLIFCSQIEIALRDFMVENGVNVHDMLFIEHAKKKAFFPFIFTLKDLFLREKYDIIHAFDTQTHVMAGWAASWAGMKNFICHCESQFLPSTVSSPKRILYRTLNFFLKDYFIMTIVVSNGLKKEFLENNFRPAQKIQLIHLGITVDDKDDHVHPGVSSAVPLIGAVSRLSVEKGLDRFIQAIPYVLRSIPGAKFLIYGDGVEKSRLSSLAQSLEIMQSIEFKPWVRDVPRALRRLDVFVMPSHREGLPITLLEAMLAGRLCVASDIEGIRDIIQNGVDGVLVDTSDILSFADAIISVCRNPGKAAAMSRAAVNKVRTSFNVEREAAEIKKLYEEVLS